MTSEKELLKNVARSFYLSLRVLPKRVRPVISLGYLLCRAADTIADTPTTPLDEKVKLLSQFKNLFKPFPVSNSPLKEFLRELEYANLSPRENEKKLLNHFEDCALWFNQLNRTDQSFIQSVVQAVITGMEMDLHVFGDASPQEPKALASEKDLEAYIHLIGGEPGQFWTRVCLAHWPNLNIRQQDQFLQDGIVFGTGLQMVNILRDFAQDLNMGRCYIPVELLERHHLTIKDLVLKEKEDVFLTLYNDLIEQTLFRLQRGLTYIEKLPRFSLGLRAAVWWPLIIGKKTLIQLRNSGLSFREEKPVKISRSTVYRLMAGSLIKLPFNGWLRREWEGRE